MERGVDRIAAEELTVPPGGDELFSLLALKAPPRVRRLGRDRRRLRADRRDAAAALVPRRGAVVAGQGARARARAAGGGAAAGAHVPRPPAARRARVRRDPAARREPRRDARAAARRRARLDPARDDARPDGRRRGDAHVHLPEPLRLRDRRRGRQPRLPRRGRRATSARWRAVQAEQLELVESGFAPVPVLRAPYFEREVLGAEMLDRLGDALFAGPRPGGGAARPRRRRSCRCTTAARSCGWTCRSSPRATCR